MRFECQLDGRGQSATYQTKLLTNKSSNKNVLWTITRKGVHFRRALLEISAIITDTKVLGVAHQAMCHRVNKRMLEKQQVQTMVYLQCTHYLYTRLVRRSLAPWHRSIFPWRLSADKAYNDERQILFTWLFMRARWSAVFENVIFFITENVFSLCLSYK